MSCTASGLDRLGSAMAVGSYEWRLLLNDGLEADYLAVVGQSVIDPAQPWVWTAGSHQGPSSVVVGAGGALYHGSKNSEGPACVETELQRRAVETNIAP